MLSREIDIRKSQVFREDIQLKRILIDQVEGVRIEKFIFIQYKILF
jgi:hypothetical protein